MLSDKETIDNIGSRPTRIVSSGIRADERKVEIEHVIDEVLKMRLASVGGEFDFYEEPVTSKIARNRPERKPIWTTTWN